MKHIDFNWFITRFLGASIAILLIGGENAWISIASATLSGIAITLLAAQTRLTAARS